MSTSEPHPCDACGSPLLPGKSSGLCSACLWQGGQPRSDDPSPEGRESMEELSALLPDFEWLEVIGHGGMGTVFKARQKRLDRIVAVKVLSEEISVDKLFASRFEREAKILARLNHPHIVTIHDFGQELDVYYLVMEYVEGVNLAQVLQCGPLDIDRAMRLARQLCAALLFAHERGILHRDIKPANILLDPEGMVKIADFGLAKLGAATEAANTLTMPGTTMGTPRYMAPEQWEAPEQVDHRADIFAFGMIFYQMLTSKVPSGMIQLPSEGTDIDPLADRIVKRCLAPEPANRYEDARALESDLVALDRTSGAQVGLRAEDSWLRPPSVQLPADNMEEATVIDSNAHDRPSTVELPVKGARRLPTRWVMAATFIALSVAGLALWKNQLPTLEEPMANERLLSLPALVGAQWWFDDMPYLIPPVRWELAQSDRLAIDAATSATAVTDLRKQLRDAALELSQTTSDMALREVLHDLLKRRSIALDEIEAKVAPLAAGDSAMWQHTYGTILQRQGLYDEAVEHYRKAIRSYRKDPAKRRLLALCRADLGRCYSISGLHEEAVVAFDEALNDALATTAPFFRVVCLADKSSSCRRIQAWDEAEQALKQAEALLEMANAEEDHPLVTYIHQRFGWLYMDDWKLREARDAFQKSIASRDQQLAIERSQDSLALSIQRSHDEMAFAMCQRYTGQDAEAIASYESVRQSLVSLKERVNRSPTAQRDWLSRYYNNNERLGDCYLFGQGTEAQAVSHFHQSALDLKRSLIELKAESAEAFQPQLGRYLAKGGIAMALQGEDRETYEATLAELANLPLGGSHQASVRLFVGVADLIWASRQDSSLLADHLSVLQRLVEENKESQFGRDEREVFLLAARELSEFADGEHAQALAQVVTMLLLKEPIDPSVLPFLRPHFDRLIEMRMKAVKGVSWDIVRDMQLAKTGSRLTDLPKVPALMVYFRGDRQHANWVRVLPDASCESTDFSKAAVLLNPKLLWQSEEMESMLEGVGEVYWSDFGLQDPLTIEAAGEAAPESIQLR